MLLHANAVKEFGLDYGQWVWSADKLGELQIFVHRKQSLRLGPLTLSNE